MTKQLGYNLENFLEFVRATLLLGASLAAISACSDAGNANAPSEDPQALSVSSDLGAAATLTEDKIDLDAALGRTPVEIIETDPCPFLPDKIAVSGVSTRFELVRRKVANDECVWNYNIGFEINVRIKPLADATPRAQRVYNLENPPVITSQSGPGTDAALFSDPTWDTDNPRPYAFGFTQDDKDIMISTVGVKTSLVQLQAVADEIAARLPLAPEISEQIRQAAEVYDPCQIWPTGAVASIFSLSSSTPNSSSAFGSTTCNYQFFPAEGSPLKVRAGVMACEDNHVIVRQGHGFSAHSSFEVPVLIKRTEEDWGTDIYLEAKQPDFCISVMSLENREPLPSTILSGLDLLMGNLIARTTSDQVDE